MRSFCCCLFVVVVVQLQRLVNQSTLTQFFSNTFKVIVNTHTKSATQKLTTEKNTFNPMGFLFHVTPVFRLSLGHGEILI